MDETAVLEAVQGSGAVARRENVDVERDDACGGVQRGV
jgi:hypothetical protein